MLCPGELGTGEVRVPEPTDLLCPASGYPELLQHPRPNAGGLGEGSLLRGQGGCHTPAVPARLGEHREEDPQVSGQQAKQAGVHPHRLHGERVCVSSGRERLESFFALV